jgi:hypothetical protein
MRRYYAPLVLLAVLAFAAPAQADVTASTITTPASPHFALFDGPGTTVDVSGRATGTGDVQIVCMGVNYPTVLAAAVPVMGDGTFSVQDLSLDPLIDQSYPFSPGQQCHLRALPAGAAPNQDGPFRGPLIALSRYSETPVITNGGVNYGRIANYHLYAAGADRVTEAHAFGACGALTAVIDPLTLRPGGGGFGCGASVVDEPQLGWAGLNVDGEPAYPPAQLSYRTGGADLTGVAGFPAFEHPSVQFDEDTGAVTVAETEGLAKCGPDNAYPPTQATCTQLDAVPVQLRRTTSVIADQQIVRVVERWSSTDGRPHRLDLAVSIGQCCSNDVVYRFPGEGGYAAHATGGVSGPFRAAAPIFMRAAGNAGSGLLVLPLQSADGARFIQSNNFGLEYRARTIPARGELTFTHYYVTTRRADELDAAAAKLIASLSKPAASSPPQAGAPRPVVLPRLSRAGHLRVRRSGRTFRVTTRDRVTCATACTVHISGRRIAATDLHVEASRTRAVRFLLTRGGARRLRHAGRLRVTYALTAVGVTTRRRLTLRVSR